MAYPLRPSVTRLNKNSAIRFVVMLGIVSLFADITYEGARSINGQYLSLLGASGFVVGTVAGFGELIGYGFRLFSGFISDKTKKYWLITFVGYFINQLAVPLLAFANSWQMASTLMILERFGKAVRHPARDAMLSYAAHETGRGWGFGLHEALDQIGAILGPLLIGLLLYLGCSYQCGYGILTIPAVCVLGFLFLAKRRYPNPENLEKSTPAMQPKGLSSTYWLYVVAACLVAAGYIDFPLIAFHAQKTGATFVKWTPVLYAIAMVADAVAALILGKLYDKKGIVVIVSAVAISLFFSLFSFSSNISFAILGMILWGLGLGAQESIMRSFVADLVHPEKRGTAYGILNSLFGVSWFLGSAFMGFLYDKSLTAVIIFSMAVQVAAIPLLLKLRHKSFDP